MCSIFTIAIHVGQCLKETADKVKERGERERGREREREREREEAEIGS